MATSLTLLPALLGFLGHRVLSRRQRHHLADGLALPDTGVWWRWSKFVAGRPLAPAVAALAVPSTKGDTRISAFQVLFAVAVAVDAFLIRIAIVPALMFLLGRSNWWIPAPLARMLPRRPMEEESDPPEQDLRAVPASAH